MSKILWIKLLTVTSLMIVLLIPLGMLSSLVQERQGERDKALYSIQESWSGSQRVIGPVLVVPYRLRTLVKSQVKELIALPPQPEVPVAPAAAGAQTPAAADAAADATRNVAVVKPRYQEVLKDVTTEIVTDHVVTFLPQTLAIDGEVGSERRYRGIYEALTYSAALTLTASFQVDVAKQAADRNITFGVPYVSVGVSDVRGISNAPVATFDKTRHASEPGNPLPNLGSGVHIPLKGFDPKVGGDHTFSLPLTVQGMGELQFSPLGKDTRVALRSDWPHPSFLGRFLPAKRTIDADGFEANWQTSWYATNIHDEFNKLVGSTEMLGPFLDFGVSFIQPVDVYQKTERVTKYGVLFVLLTFVAFVLYELLRQLRIHPLQYALVGAAQAIFYLLLIALSEHIAFGLAYALATVACVAVIGFYLAHVLQRWQRGVGFAAALAALYASLYGMLQSEDNALLIGSLLLFAALTAVMTLTRKLNWYALPVPGRETADPA